MKYFILAGESSGDIHGANLIRAIKQKDSNAEFAFWGGDVMESVAGVKALCHVHQLAFMGFWEVMVHLKIILRLFKNCKRDIQDFEPDVLILIDYPGFNLRMAKWATLQNIKVVYYIVPQVWAWHQSRVKKLKKFTHTLIAILPFEEDFFKRHDCDVVYVGHPLLDELNHWEEQNIGQEKDQKKRYNLALLPGSRKQEIELMLPIFLTTAEALNLDCIIAKSQHLPEEFYTNIIQKTGVSNINVELLSGKMYHILHNSLFAFVTSGTATLETALCGTPQVVCYKGSSISYWIAKKLVKLSYISLVNLILNKALVKELIQQDMTKENLILAYHEGMKNKNNILEGYEQLRHVLGSKGASNRAADVILDIAAK
ncbi:MAG: lipid-A-disaccharide synthase [Saprospiraceae bacterium]